MDPRLLRHYNAELGFLREMGAEFAGQFPKIAARLGIDGLEVVDPYVERLLEGVAFLTARLQLKLDAEFPRFTEQLLNIVQPQFLAPLPAMLIACFQPDVNDPGLLKGFPLPQGSGLRSLLGRGDATACEFRTAHALTLWPISLETASYSVYPADLPLARLGLRQPLRGALRLRLRCGGGLKFAQLPLDRLPIWFGGHDETAWKLLELALGHCLGVLVLPIVRPATWHRLLPPEAVAPLGFADDEALLPQTLKGFSGYRLLREYQALPERFRFIELQGLASAFAQADSDEIEIVLLFDRGDSALESLVDASHCLLHCSPAVNLFSRRCDRIALDASQNEYPVVPDRTRPLDFEVYAVETVEGYSAGNVEHTRFLPFYSAYHNESGEHMAYFTTRREPRLPSLTQKRHGARSSHVGSEVFLSLVDASEAPYPAVLRQVGVTAQCTNRDLPLLMPLGVGTTDFELDGSAPLQAIRCAKGPSRPWTPTEVPAWRAIDHLSLNYLSLVEADPTEGAAALRRLLTLYAPEHGSGLRNAIDGLRHIRVKPRVARFPLPGPLAFGRGLEITLEVDEMAFQGGSAFLFGQVMERFLARHVSLNSFTETVLISQTRGEVMRWKPRLGARATL